MESLCVNYVNILLNWLQHGIRCAEHLERQGLDGKTWKSYDDKGSRLKDAYMDLTGWLYGKQ